MADVFADIPEGYTRNRIDPGLRRILDSVADGILEMLPGRVTRLVEASPFVEITSMLTADGRRMLLHLVNYDVTLDGDVTPARRIKLNVALPPKKAAQAVSFSGTLSEMKSCEFKKLAGGRAISFELDEVRTYGLAEIRLE
jgi:hypothetical protein